MILWFKNWLEKMNIQSSIICKHSGFNFCKERTFLLSYCGVSPEQSGATCNLSTSERTSKVPQNSWLYRNILNHHIVKEIVLPPSLYYLWVFGKYEEKRVHALL